MSKRSLLFGALTITAAAPACTNPGETSAESVDELATRPAILTRASRSTAVDITTDDRIIAMVNTDDGSVSFFETLDGAQERLRSRVASSNRTRASEPNAVVLHPDGRTAFVANRATGTVSRIASVRVDNPAITAEVDAGAEPMGLALTPTGAKLYVTDWVNGEVVVIDTQSMAIDRKISVGGSPFAIAITHDGDFDDADEKALVTQFFARGRSGAAQVEGSDDGREGIVQVIPIGHDVVTNEIALAPIASCFTAAVGNPPVALTSGCFPNQLLGITVHTANRVTRAYVVSTGASPQGPINFNHNVQALVSVVHVEREAEETAFTVNLNKLIRDQQVDNDNDENVGRRFMNLPNGIAFEPRSDAAIGYVTSAGSDIALRVEWAQTGAATVGTPSSFNIVVGQNPQGLVTHHGRRGQSAYVANLITRNLSVVSAASQSQLRAVLSTAQPSDPSTTEFKIWRGKRFFNTSTGIWSREGWGSCQGCHYLGLSDGVTWKFAAGPRQTISMDGQFASNDPSDMRALNWTAIFDETHDFENNTRGVSGGRGAFQDASGPLVSANNVNNFSAILMEDGTTRENHQALNGSMTFLSRNSQVCANGNTCPDWDLIDQYVMSIRSPRGKQDDANLIAQGRQVFQQAGCDACHAGAKWTISRTFYRTPDFAGALPTRTFATNRAASTPMDTTALRALFGDVNRDATLVAGDDSGGGLPALKRQACNVRDVQTFAAQGGADETRDNGTPAQGRNGFNPPSLLGLAVSAPYFHNGAAATLPDAFDTRFTRHMTAGNPSFNPTQAEKTALVAFLSNIDETTQIFPVRTETVLCPPTFAP